MSITGQDTATHLIPRRVLDPVEWDHIMVVGLGHIKARKHLGLVVVQIGGVSQLTRDMGEERRRSCGTTRGRRKLTRGRHCVKQVKAKEDLLSSFQSLLFAYMLTKHVLITGYRSEDTPLTNHDWSYAFPCLIMFTNMLSHTTS